jgi:uncharacterized protein YprB with RNaseH-like and TPR domain
VYGLDIETDTSIDGLDPAVGGVLAVAVATADAIEVLSGIDEARLLAQLDALLRGLRPGVVVTWNGSRFDLPYLAARAHILGVELGLRLAVDPTRPSRPGDLPGSAPGYLARWHDHGHLDVYRCYRADVGPALRVGCSLKTVAALVGLDPIEVDASQVHLLDQRSLARYVGSDARCARELACRRWPAAARGIDRMPRPGETVAERRPLAQVAR